MNKKEAKELVVDLVARLQGCKALDLVAHPEILGFVASIIAGVVTSKLLEELVDEGQLVEVEYTLPAMAYRESFFLPAGTQISINGGVDTTGNRILSEEAKTSIRDAFAIHVGCGVPEDALVRLLADHCIGILELPESELGQLYARWTKEEIKQIETAVQKS